MMIPTNPYLGQQFPEESLRLACQQQQAQMQAANLANQQAAGLAGPGHGGFGGMGGFEGLAGGLGGLGGGFIKQDTFVDPVRFAARWSSGPSLLKRLCAKAHGFFCRIWEEMRDEARYSTPPPLRESRWQKQSSCELLEWITDMESRG